MEKKTWKNFKLSVDDLLLGFCVIIGVIAADWSECLYIRIFSAIVNPFTAIMTSDDVLRKVVPAYL